MRSFGHFTRVGPLRIARLHDAEHGSATNEAILLGFRIGAIGQVQIDVVNGGPRLRRHVLQLQNRALHELADRQRRPGRRNPHLELMGRDECRHRGVRDCDAELYGSSGRSDELAFVASHGSPRREGCDSRLREWIANVVIAVV